MQNLETRKWLQSSPKEPLARTLGTLIHDLNNPLTILSARSYQLEQLLEDPNPNLGKIKEVSASLSSLVNQLGNQIKTLKIATKCPSQDRILTYSTSKLITECIEILKSQNMGTSVQFELFDETQNLDLELKPLHFQQALLHILLNASEAEGAAKKSVQIHSAVTNKNWVITVSNSITSQLSVSLEKCFEPFYTTKSDHFGLGLPLAQTLIEDSGGTLKLKLSADLWIVEIQIPI